MVKQILFYWNINKWMNIYVYMQMVWQKSQDILCDIIHA